MKSSFQRPAVLAAAMMLGLAACSEPSPPPGAGSIAPAEPPKADEPVVDDASSDETQAESTTAPTEQVQDAKSPAEAYEIATIKAQGQYDLAVQKCGDLRSQRGKDKCQEAATVALERSVAQAEAALNAGLDSSPAGDAPKQEPPAADAEDPPKQ